MYVLCDYFFFQAEDGIRDGHVTGVQTCALPIYPFFTVRAGGQDVLTAGTGGANIAGTLEMSNNGEITNNGGTFSRSEERRVGKECRFRLATEDQKEKRERISRRIETMRTWNACR